MGNMKKLKWLQVVGAPQLTGPIPTQIGKMTDLQSITFVSVYHH
jgi:hypothetical protein